MALSNETILGRRYALRARIAVGGMGEVWRAEDTLLHRIVAVKVLKSELSSDPSFIDRFRAEATTTASLSHPGIAGIFDYGEVRSGDEPPVAYLVMELVRGEPLSAILAAEGRLPVARTLDIVGQVATALQVAHAKGMVHRDIKPGNVIVSPDGAVKVTDFGIARVAYAVPLTEHGMVVGTAQYFSPEQAQGEVVATASDIYSLGVVAYECLAGRLPFVAENPLTVALMQIRDEPPPLPADVSPAARTLVMRCLAKSPRQRYQTGGELAGAVRVAQTDPNAALRRAAEPAPVPALGGLARPLHRSPMVGPERGSGSRRTRSDHRRDAPASRPATSVPPAVIAPSGGRRGVVITSLVVIIVGVLVLVVLLVLKRSGNGAVGSSGTSGILEPATPGHEAAAGLDHAGDHLGRTSSGGGSATVLDRWTAHSPAVPVPVPVGPEGAR